MDEKMNHHGPGPEFEQRDLTPGTIYAFLTGLVVMLVVVYFVIGGVYHILEDYQRAHQPAENPLVQPAPADTRVVPPGEITKFPQPRLEGNERTELGGFRLREEQQLNTYGWVDQQAGIVHIPIERAMQLIAERGLPTTPRTGTVPPSEVNVVEQAAQRADVSNVANTKKK